VLADAAGGELGQWSGSAALRFDAAADAIASRLRAEAGALRDTADAIRSAIARAVGENDRRIAARRAAEARSSRAWPAAPTAAWPKP
jgi:uncharacterized protein YukE